MRIVEFDVSIGRLTDVGCRSAYVALTLFDRTAWVQWWPRPIFDVFVTEGPDGGPVRIQRPKLTAGIRGPGGRVIARSYARDRAAA
jgi:hypothetical protein